MDRGTLQNVMETTWPPAQKEKLGPWIIRISPGGGKRVTAASTETSVSPDQIDAAATHMGSLGQPVLFSVLPKSETDTKLQQSGYLAVDETWIYQAPIGQLTQRPVPPVTAFPIWPPLQLARDIWAAGGIGDDRLAIMERAECEKTAILGRVNDRAGGVLYAGISDACVMVHALEILETQRRAGLASHMMIAAAHWGQQRGAKHIAVLVTRANEPANALYRRLGMDAMRGYHYRIRP